MELQKRYPPMAWEMPSAIKGKMTGALMTVEFNH